MRRLDVDMHAEVVDTVSSRKPAIYHLFSQPASPLPGIGDEGPGLQERM